MMVHVCVAAAATLLEEAFPPYLLQYLYTDFLFFKSAFKVVYMGRLV